ncbi:MAG: glycosyltransferase family 2 protein [Nitrososphaerales archaeon]
MEPLLSVIITAKNEQDTIGACIASIQAQSYANIEIIVMDDNSQDRTKEIATEFQTDSRVRVVSLSEKPANFLGKSWACQKGFENSRGDVLLFVDADSTFNKEAIEISLSYLISNSLDMFSISPKVSLKGPWAYSTLPLVSAGINLLYPMKKVNDPKSKRAYVFGTFILVRRSVYESIGGHASVRDKLVEDAAIAQLVKSKGFKLKVALGESLIQTDWEKDFHSVYRGMERVFSDSVRPYGLISILDAVLLFFLGLYPLIFIAFSILFQSSFDSLTQYFSFIASLLSVLFAILISANELYRATGKKLTYQSLLYPLGFVLFVSAIVTTAIKVRRSQGFYWKGEKYIQTNHLKEDHKSF